MSKGQCDEKGRDGYSCNSRDGSLISIDVFGGTVWDQGNVIADGDNNLLSEKANLAIHFDTPSTMVINDPLANITKLTIEEEEDAWKVTFDIPEKPKFLFLQFC